MRRCIHRGPKSAWLYPISKQATKQQPAARPINSARMWTQRLSQIANCHVNQIASQAILVHEFACLTDATCCQVVYDLYPRILFMCIRPCSLAGWTYVASFILAKHGPDMCHIHYVIACM